MLDAHKLRYRPDIDGLRAIAVLSVILFHAGFSCPGGFVGVDVFFVISGFLITSLIWKDLESGQFTFGNFWERRARRIAPALIVVTIATLFAGWFFLLPDDYRSLGQATASQSALAANIHYWRDTGYFGGRASEKPLLHTWSLAVEEQFYLIVPFLFWGIYCMKKLRTRAAVLSMLAVGCIISFALSVYVTPRAPGPAFYLLPTRAWELLFGSIVAFLPAVSLLQVRREVRELLGLTGLALILVPVFIFHRETPFPGLNALYPCLGAAVLIWSGGHGKTSVTTVLSSRPMVFVGLISYSLYLWHWPLLAFAEYTTFAPLAPGLRAGLVVIAFACAILSWKYVETPFRKRQLCATRKAMFASAGAGLAAVFGLGLVCMAAKGFPRRIPQQALQFANVKFDGGLFVGVSEKDVRSGKLMVIGDTTPGLRPTVFLWGDSHAMAASPAVDELLREKGIAGRAATHPSTPPVLNWQSKAEGGLFKAAIPFNDAVFAYIEKNHFTDVIMIGRWGAYKPIDNISPLRLGPSLLATVRKLVAIGSRPWVLMDVPNQELEVPKALALSVMQNTDLIPFMAKPGSASELGSDDAKLIAELRAAGALVIDPKPRFIDPSGKYYIIESKGTPIYMDSHHLSLKGAKMVLLPFLRDTLSLKPSPRSGLSPTAAKQP